MNLETIKEPGGTRRIISIVTMIALLLSTVLPAVTEDANAAGFSGKVGSKYTVTSGGRITYGSGEGG